MRVPVLKAFPYAHDGCNFEQLEAGAVVEIHDELIQGLSDEGYIGEPGSTPPSRPEAVEIPANWRELHWFKQLALARRLTGDAVSNKPAAIAVIEAELAVRG